MFVVFDYKTIIFIVISIIVVLGSIVYFLRDCNCKTGPQGPEGKSFDMSNYVGNVNVKGDILASGKIKSGNCELNCVSPTPSTNVSPSESSSSSSTGWIIGSVIFGVILVGAGSYYFFIISKQQVSVMSSSMSSSEDG